jgi:hypothetical protein
MQAYLLNLAQLTLAAVVAEEALAQMDLAAQE